MKKDGNLLKILRQFETGKGDNDVKEDSGKRSAKLQGDIEMTDAIFDRKMLDLEDLVFTQISCQIRNANFPMDHSESKRKDMKKFMFQHSNQNLTMMTRNS